jgi:hypothetical protein
MMSRVGNFILSRTAIIVTVVAVAGSYFGLACQVAEAAPIITSTAVVSESVTATGVTLEAGVNPGGSTTTYRFEYLPAAVYEENLEASPPREAFAGASLAPASGSGLAGVGKSPIRVTQHISGLPSETSYRFRVRAVNAANESVVSIPRPFSTGPPTNAFELLDHRGWEMVSPIEKVGGAVQAPGAVSGGGVFQAAGGGGAFTFSSANSFGESTQGAPAGSQYLAVRTGGGWSTADVTTPLLSGSYGSEPNGVPYQLFSGDLAFSLLSNGERCRGRAGGECPVANPPLPGSGAPAGFRDYYRRGPNGTFESVLTQADLEYTNLGPEQFEMRLVAATPDLAHVVVSSCAALTPNATEVPAPGGCDPEKLNLYEWSGGALSLINVLPSQTLGTPGAEIAAPSGAVSIDGSRVYFASGEGIYLREGSTTKTVIEAPEAKFEGAGADGEFAYIVVAERLDRFRASDGNLFPLTLGTGVEGVLGVSADGTRAYYARSGAVFFRNGEALSEAASSALSTDWPAATGTARVSADGLHLLFLSKAELTGYPSEGETEVFLYGPPPGGTVPLLVCVSCNPSGEKPQGSASIPGVRRNGEGEGAFESYKPRVLSASGNRVFFETTDMLVPQDTNRGAVDVYEWEAAGEGTCGRGGGCIQLISGGRGAEPSLFLDADESGSEAFFLTDESLYPLDPGSGDIYAAREGGGFAVPESPIPCIADACQVLPEAPEDPAPGTLTPNSGNPVLKVSGGSTGKSPSKKKHHKKKSKHKKKTAKGKGARK